jgi:hypothetical protein
LTEGLPVNDKNSQGFTPLAIYLKKRNCLKIELAPALGENVVQLLLDAHADVNVWFPETRFTKDPLDTNQAYLDELKESKIESGKQPEEERSEDRYFCTPLILLCR